MYKSELATHVAAETSLPKAAAYRTVGILFSIITEALAAARPSPLPGSAHSRPETAPRVRDATPRRASPSPSPPPRRHRSRPGVPSRHRQFNAQMT